jgi:energy-coupling factor transporter ATP-binding protein EcfA2
MSSVLINKGQDSFLTQQTAYNPFPGLRPFTPKESHLFFGREGQSEEILEKLSDNKFVAVVGTSGSGKSSLMYCGVLPILHGGFVQGAGSNWQIVTTRPGSAPINNLAEAIQKSKSGDDNSTEGLALNSAILRSSSNGLIDIASQFEDDKSILVVVDQFEELFRFKNSTTNENAVNESVAFVKLLLNAVKDKNSKIYVVLTMRSDFIGDCAQFQELTELINDSQYLIPRMTREDVQNAIKGPIAVGGGEISDRLTNQLLNEIGDNQDQLPILQHALMRTWDYWSKFKTEGEIIDIAHYESIGRMEKALSEHANEAFDELTVEGKEICQNLFKTITEKGAENRGTRRPTQVKEIAEIAICQPTQIIEIFDNFSRTGRSFLTSSDSDVTENSIIDISHESLMRIWDRLIAWVEEESGAVAMYIKLSESAALFQVGKTGLWRPPDLQLATQWREQKRPTLTWAIRHNVAFERTMSFLDASVLDYEAEERNKVKLQKKALRRSRIFAIVLGSAAVILMGVLVWAIQQKVEADNQRLYAQSQSIIAEENAKQAQIEKEKAKKSALEAIEAQKESEKNFLLAEENRQQALQNLNIAKINEGKARAASQRAKESAAQAQQSATEALKQKNLADQSSKKAQNLRMLSIAQSMAVKSQQIKKDLDQKSLVAYQAYLFNKKYEGEDHHGDIYTGLYDVLKAKYPTDYNNLIGHKSSVRSISTNPNSNLLMTTGSDGNIFSWNLKDSASSKLIGNTGEINRALALSEGDKWLACGTERNKIILFDLANGSKKTLKGHSKVVWDLQFMDNNTLISASADSTVRLWSLGDEKNIIIAKAKSRIKSISISPNKKYIVGASDKGEIIMWDKSKDYSSTILYKNETRSITQITFSKDGKHIAFGDLQGQVSVFNLNSKSIEYDLIGQSARITDLQFSNNDKFLASASYDGTVQVFLTANYDLSPLVLKDHDSWVSSLSFTNNDKTLVTGTMNSKIKRYPTNIDQMSTDICSLISRNLTNKEWRRFVAKDIEYEKTCPAIK